MFHMQSGVLEFGPRIERVLDRATYDVTVFKVHFGRLTLKVYDKGARVLRIEVITHSIKELRCGKRLEKLPIVLARLQPRLRELLSLLDPVTECLRTNAVPTLKKSVDDGPLSTGLPAYRELLDSIVGLAGASQNFDGNGPALRYHAGFGDEVVSLGQGSPEGALAGLTSEPILGSRPAYTGVRPPFRPDVPCGQNQPPDLKAATGPPPPERRLGG